MSPRLRRSAATLATVLVVALLSGCGASSPARGPADAVGTIDPEAVTSTRLCGLLDDAEVRRILSIDRPELDRSDEQAPVERQEGFRSCRWKWADQDMSVSRQNFESMEVGTEGTGTVTTVTVAGREARRQVVGDESRCFIHLELGERAWLSVGRQSFRDDWPSCGTAQALAESVYRSLATP